MPAHYHGNRKTGKGDSERALYPAAYPVYAPHRAGTQQAVTVSGCLTEFNSVSIAVDRRRKATKTGTRILLVSY